MKRKLFCAIGAIVFASMVFCSIQLAGAGNARAAGLAASGTPNPRISEKKADGSTAALLLGVIRRNDVADAKTAANTQPITSDKSLSGTYNKNIFIYNDAIVTISRNVTINGDLILEGAMLKITSGTLTVNGRIIVGFNSAFMASGSAKIVVNRAPSGTTPGGIVGVDGDAGTDSGVLSLVGGVTMTINNKTDKNGGFQSFGALIMASSSSGKPKLVVNASICDFEGCSTEGLLTAGTLEVHGNFFQNYLDTGDLGFSQYADSYCPSPGFLTVFAGTPPVQKYVYFGDSSGSFLTSFAFTGGFRFTSNSWISFYRSLSADLSIDCNNANVEFGGALNGHKLTLKAAMVMPAEGGSLSVGSGTLTVNGTFAIDTYQGLSMTKAAGKTVVNGSFIAEECSFNDLTAGQIDINGSFFQIASDSHLFQAGPGMKVRILGAKRVVSFENPTMSWFSNFELAPGASLDGSSVVSIDWDLTKNVSWNIPVLYYSGSLNGHSLTLKGDLHPIDVNVGSGTLTVNGDLTAYGALTMKNSQGTVRVNGDYTTSQDDSRGNLTAGRLYVGGSFFQQGTFSFNATGGHTTILNGKGAQAVNFEDVDASSGSKFAHLIVTNDGFDAKTLPAGCYDDLVVAGESFKGIDATAGTLSPAFAPKGKDYMLYLPEGTDSATVTPHLLDGYDPAHVSMTVTVQGGAAADSATQADIAGVPLHGGKAVTIDVYVFSAPYQTKTSYIEKSTYHIKAEPLDPNLKSGTAGLGKLPEGSCAGYDAGTRAYEVDLPETAASFTFAPVTDDPEATASVDGSAHSRTVSVPLAGSLTCAVRVTAQDGKTTRDYTVKFTRRNPVSGITVTSGSLSFDKATAAYTVSVPPTATSVTVNVACNQADCAEIDINGVKQSGTDQASIPLTLSPSADAAAKVEVWDADRKTVTTYTVTVKSRGMLSGIRLSAGKLSPSFARQTLSYSVYLPNSTASVTITPQKTLMGTGVTINGGANSVTLSPSAGGKGTATIKCKDGAVSQTYSVIVYRIMPVSGIFVSPGALTPAFSANSAAYTVSVPATTSSVTVSVHGTDSLKTMKINGHDAAFNASGVALCALSPAVGGSASARIVATAQNGAVYTYTVTVKRALLLTGIRLSAGSLAPSFNPTILSYTVNVPATTSQVKITPVKAKGSVKSVSIDGTAASSVTLKPPVGGNASARMVVTGLDGTTKMTYTVTVKRAALITEIRLSTGTLLPDYSPTRLAYTVNIPATATSVTITPVKGTAVKTLTINGKAVSSLSVAPTLEAPVTVTIAAAASGSAKSTYTLTVRKLAPLTGISVTGGAPSRLFPLAQAFSPGRTSYDVYVPADIAAVTVGASTAGGCTYTVNGSSIPVSLAVGVGGAATATIRAKASDGSTTAVYQVTVHRAYLLSDISVKPAGLPNFKPDVKAYDYYVQNSIQSLVVTPAATAGCTFTIDGNAVASKAVSIDAGSSVTVTIVATAADHKTQDTYTVTIHRAANPVISVSAIGYEDTPLVQCTDNRPNCYTFNDEIADDAVLLTVQVVDGDTVTINGQAGPSVYVYPLEGRYSIDDYPVVVKQGHGLPDFTFTITINWN